MKTLISRHVAVAVGTASLALLAAGCASSSPAPAPAASSSAPAASASSPAGTATPGAATAAVLKTETTKLGPVLTDAKGLTLYWFAADTPATSACTGACAAAWPPVIGMPQAASGVTLSGKFGEIRRPDGTMQATYNGHPLYTFASDTAPGQTNGNGLTGFGARWSVITVTSKASAATPAATPSATSGGGMGYGSGSGGGGW